MTPEATRLLYERLTPRERDYARLLVTGTTTNKDIADAMGVNYGWINRYATSLFDKTGTDNRVELALFIVRHPELEELLCSQKSV